MIELNFGRTILSCAVISAIYGFETYPLPTTKGMGHFVFLPQAGHPYGKVTGCM